MQREIKMTEDGSKTLYIDALDENYHSYHGALKEAKHVFVDNGLRLVNGHTISILEMGFGTGLNFMASIEEVLKRDSSTTLHYYSLEKYPITNDEVQMLNYGPLFDFENAEQLFFSIHQPNWNEEIEILPNIFLSKYRVDFFDLSKLDFPSVDLVYYDCFGAKAQPELWEQPLFEMLTKKVKPNALFSTYSSKGSVQRILKTLGYKVEKKPGPPGKREMINAWKL